MSVSVKDVRPFIVICFVKNLNLTGDNLRKLVNTISIKSFFLNFVLHFSFSFSNLFLLYFKTFHFIFFFIFALTIRKFLQLQTKLHKDVCANRTLATIATHDLAAIKGTYWHNIRYTSFSLSEAIIKYFPHKLWKNCRKKKTDDRGRWH